MNQRIEEILLFQIDLTSKKSKIYSQREFDRLGMNITVEQWILLKIVQENPDISQKALAEKSLRDPASITRTLDLIEKRNLIRRNSIPGNRRQYSIDLTRLGDEFVSKYLPEVEKQRKLSVNGISELELALVQKVLIKMQENMV